MNKLWVIATKDISEAFRSRSTYLYIVIMFALSLVYFNTFGARMDAVIAGDPGAAAIRETAQDLLDSFMATMPMMFSIWVCTIFATYAVIVEKAKRNIESLMVTPISLKQLWLGKSLAVALPSVIVGIGVSLIIFLVLNFTQIIPVTGVFLFPALLSVLCDLILAPLLIFTVITIVLFLQLTISNPRFASFIFLGLFLMIYIGMNLVIGIGLSGNLALIYLAAIVVCALISALLSRSLTKERVMLSSKNN